MTSQQTQVKSIANTCSLRDVDRVINQYECVHM